MGLNEFMEFFLLNERKKYLHWVNVLEGVTPLISSKFRMLIFFLDSGLLEQFGQFWNALEKLSVVLTFHPSRK